MLPLTALPHTALNVAFRLMIETNRAKSFPSVLAEIDMAPLCGKIVFKHSIVLFLRIVSFVTPEAGTKAFSSAFLAAFRKDTPSYV